MNRNKNYFEESGNIRLLSNEELIKMSIDDVLAYKIMTRKKVLEMHKAPITQGKGDDKRWSTYVPDETAKSKRRLIRKATEEQVINELVKFYAHVEKQTSTKRKRFPKDITVKEFYPKWVEYKMQNPKLSTETIKRYKSDYTRCIEYSEFGQLRLCDVDEIDIEEFLVAEIECLNLKKRAVSNLKGYLNQMFKYARRSRIIESNPCDLVDCQDNVYPYCAESGKTKEERTLSDDEMITLRAFLHQHQKDYPLYMPDYAIEICTWTGLRVGEVAVLRWDMIKDGELHITQSEHRIVHEDGPDTYEIGLTKNQKERRVPIGKELEELLNRIQQLQEDNSIKSEYIIADVKGRVIAPTISKAMYRRGCEAGTKAKCIHAIRRTVASKLYKKYPKPTVAYIMGHTEEVLDKHYAYDTIALAEKQTTMDGLYTDVA